MTFGREDIKSLLGQIPGIGFRSREAQRESKQRLVVFLRNGFQMFGEFHIFIGFTILRIGGHICSMEIETSQWD